MPAFLQLTSFFPSLLILFDVSSSLFTRRGDTGPVDEAAVLGTTNPAQLALWNPTTGVHYSDVAQGTNGDCWLGASMASVAYADPNHIRQIMVNDGTQAKVTLWDGSTMNTYKVMKRTINDMKSSYSVAAPIVTGGEWVWPACMEDAFMDLAKNSSTGINEQLYGGSSLQAFGAMYGPSTLLTYKKIAITSDDDLWAIWLNVSSKPTVSTSNADNNTNLANGLPSYHGYSAMRSDQGKGIVTLRNPWGTVSQDPSWGTSNGGGQGVTDRGDGVFDISFTDWKTYFEEFIAVS